MSSETSTDKEEALSPRAIGSLVVGVVAVLSVLVCTMAPPPFNLVIPLVAAVVALWWGIVTLKGVRDDRIIKRNQPYAMAGVILGAITAVIAILLTIALYQEQMVERGDVGGGPFDEAEERPVHDRDWRRIDE
ncbi:MAG: hypothetical protein ACNA8W_25495 [Bradymonadaceae bacterium]